MSSNADFYIPQERELYLSLQGIDSKWPTASSTERNKLAQENHLSWAKFRDSLEEKLEPEHRINPVTIANLKELFERFKYRNKETIKAEEILPFHYELTKNWEFDVPIHSKNMAHMLHPHWGYLTKLRDVELSFDGLTSFYEKEIKASLLRNMNKPYLANRVSAFNYWEFLTQDGAMKFSDFGRLLEVSS